MGKNVWITDWRMRQLYNFDFNFMIRDDWNC